MRTGVVLDQEGGALAKMLPFFRLGIGGPVAGGRQYMPWIHADDIVGLYLAAARRRVMGGADQRRAPEPATNRDFSRALGRALHRPAFAPVPGLAVRLLYGDMAEIVTTGQRAVPMRALERGYAFRHTDLEQALRDALGLTTRVAPVTQIERRPPRRRPRGRARALRPRAPALARAVRARPRPRSSAACR